jgi:hypothetical protein
VRAEGARWNKKGNALIVIFYFRFLRNKKQATPRIKMQPQIQIPINLGAKSNS